MASNLIKILKKLLDKDDVIWCNNDVIHLPQTAHNKLTLTTTNLIISTTDEGRGIVKRRRDIITAIVRGRRQ